MFVRFTSKQTYRIFFLVYFVWHTPQFKHSRPQSCDPFGQRDGLRPLAGARVTRKRNSCPFLWPIVTVIVSNFWGWAQKPKSVIRGLPASVPARGLDPWRWPQGSRPLGTRMQFKMLVFAFQNEIWIALKFQFYCFGAFLFIVVMEILLFTKCKPRLSSIQNQQVLQISCWSDKMKSV